jgi:hypothetical protein
LRKTILASALIASLAAPTAFAADTTAPTAPASKDALAAQLLDNLQLDPNVITTERTKFRPGFANVATLYADGKYSEALQAYYAYFQTKARSPREFGLAWEEVNPYAGGLNGKAEKINVIAEADKLMGGVASIGGKDVTIGEPGKVDWNYPPKANTPATVLWVPDVSLYTATVFMPLAHAYLLTHDQKYLNRWAAYIDDWYANCHTVDELHPCFIPDRVNASATASLIAFSHVLFGLAANTDADNPVMPRATMEIISKFLSVNLPAQALYLRSNTHNWTPSTGFVHAAMLFDEYKASRFIFREGRRRQIEDNATTQNLQDGGENQQDPWYNAVYPSVSEAINLFADRTSMEIDIPWIAAVRNDARWAAELRSHVKDRLTEQIHLRAPAGEMPIPFRGGDKRWAPLGAEFTHNTIQLSPEALSDPVNRAILDATSNYVSNAEPPYTSDWFPFAGFNIVRDGWKRDSAYGAMFTSPQPGAYGAYRSRSNNNTFGMAAYGQDLIIDDTTGHYMYPLSPLTVDGKNQFFHAGIYKNGITAPHKVYQVTAWLKPANYRWLSSDNYNLMEGVYAGSYGDPSQATSIPGTYGLDESSQPTLRSDQTIRGVTHQRLAFYLRAHKIWIVADRILSTAPHSYEQVWFLPITPSPSAAFAPEQIRLDNTAQRITTNATTFPLNGKPAPMANVSLYQFSTTPLTYTSKSTPRPLQFNRQLMYGYMRIGGQWRGDGNQQVVTVIVPRAPGSGPEGDLRDQKRITGGKTGIGFEATAPDGALVRYLASPTPGDALTLGDIAIKGQSLLVSGNTGVALDCDAMTIAGKPVSPGTRDFEFAVANGALSSITPIYRPINPVTVSPARNMFADSCEISMSTDTPGVEIRYTTDGTTPTPQSTLYAKPFTITQTAQLNARAYRPKLDHNPYDTSETMASVTTTAYYDKIGLLNPAPPLPRPKPGLTCSYYEGDWKTMLERFDDLKPAATANVPDLWDFTVVPASNPALGQKPAPRSKYYALDYSGFLNIPADGVYTFTAPHEYIWPDQQSGYDLRVYVGASTVRGYALNEWYPATRLHAFGTWSIGLKKGLQPFRLTWIDYRTDAAAKLNQPGVNDYVWTGVTPKLLVSGPGLEPQPIPTSWFVYAGSLKP